MRVLVTGANGFIGSAIVRALLEAGHEPLGLVRSLERGREIETCGASLAVGDMLRPESYAPLVAEVDAVIHAAQAKPHGRWTTCKIRAMFHSDALMSRTLAQACLDREIPLIYTSGTLARRGRGDEWIDENSPLRPCLLARGHAEMEAELADLHQNQGARVMIVAPGFVYGPGGFLAETVDLIRQRKYRVIGQGDNYWGMVHVDDLARLYALVLSRGRPGDTYFACDDEPLTRRTVIDEIAKCLDAPRVGGVPGWLAGLALGFPLVEAITSSIRTRNSATRETLGWRPTRPSFVEALPDVLAQSGARASLEEDQPVSASAVSS